MDAVRVARQTATIEWWVNRRPLYQVFTSELTLVEARQGDRVAAARRLSALQGIPLLPVTDAVEELTNALISAGAVPASAEIDAAHIAVSAVHGVDYLLTWNFRHIANLGTQPLIHAVCEGEGYTSPRIGSLFALMGEAGNG